MLCGIGFACFIGTHQAVGELLPLEGVGELNAGDLLGQLLPEHGIAQHHVPLQHTYGVLVAPGRLIGLEKTVTCVLLQVQGAQFQRCYKPGFAVFNGRSRVTGMQHVQAEQHIHIAAHEAVRGAGHQPAALHQIIPGTIQSPQFVQALANVRVGDRDPGVVLLGQPYR